jgi:hypothetical protein
MILYSESTLRRRRQLDAVLERLGDYRDPGWIPSPAERAQCAAMLDVDDNPATVAELVQAAYYPD